MKPLVFLPTSLCVPATMESDSDLKELFQTCRLSLTVRSKPTQLPGLSRKWKRDNWMRVLCSRISPTFHLKTYVENLGYSARVSPANPSAVPDVDNQPKIPDTSIQESQTEFPFACLNMSSSKMYGGSSQPKPQTENRYSSMSSETWKAEVTERSGASLVRRKQARHTNASDASSLRNYPTPEAHTVEKYSLQKDGQKKTQRSRNLTAMAINGELSNWATPQASDHVEGARTAKESNQKCLGRDLNQMENWPTPRAGNPGSRKPGTGGKILAEEAKIHAGPPAPEKSSTSGKNHGSPKLNPNWVEQLMGLEVGWTQLPTEWIDSDS